MARYYLLMNWTDQGVRAAKETMNRAAKARQMFEKHGARMIDCTWTLGPYDAVVAAEAPDDETMTSVCLALASQGNVKTTTLRAFGEEEMKRILAKV